MICLIKVVLLTNSFFTEILLCFARNIVINILCKIKLGVPRKSWTLEKGSATRKRFRSIALYNMFRIKTFLIHKILLHHKFFITTYSVITFITKNHRKLIFIARVCFELLKQLIQVLSRILTLIECIAEWFLLLITCSVQI